MMAADWLQGPYVYALYEERGFDRAQIGQLFLAGFGSSLALGTVVGSLADRLGRRVMSLAYAVIYALACLTKHSSDYWVLMAGRLLGGMSTSLLFSVFESWVGAQHRRLKLKAPLGGLFSEAAFFGNGVAAIASGVTAHVLVESLGLGKTAPFDLALVLLALGFALVACTWDENYGAPPGKAGGEESAAGQFRRAVASIRADERVWRTGLSGALFEGAMYCFVFQWTPALASPGGAPRADVPHGVVFACFMGACMVGSLAAERLMRRGPAARYVRGLFAASSALLALPAVANRVLPPALSAPGTGILVGEGGISASGQLALAGFVLYEATVGVYWPTVMSLRALYVDESVRATVISLFRAPVNLLVCLVLLRSGRLSGDAVFALCSAMVALSAVLAVTRDDGRARALGC